MAHSVQIHGQLTADVSLLTTLYSLLQALLRIWDSTLHLDTTFYWEAGSNATHGTPEKGDTDIRYSGWAFQNEEGTCEVAADYRENIFTNLEVIQETTTDHQPDIDPNLYVWEEYWAGRRYIDIEYFAARRCDL